MRISDWSSDVCSSDLKWLNFGGGHHITRADYQRDELVLFLKRIRETTGLDLYLEPGEAVALDAGILVGEILDVMNNGIPVAITDISATCHMPDVIEAPRSEEHTSELQSLMRISYAVFCLKKKTNK